MPRSRSRSRSLRRQVAELKQVVTGLKQQVAELKEQVADMKEVQDRALECAKSHYASHCRLVNTVDEDVVWKSWEERNR